MHQDVCTPCASSRSPPKKIEAEIATSSLDQEDGRGGSTPQPQLACHGANIDNMGAMGAR
jgi:hypothetical protein